MLLRGTMFGIAGAGVLALLLGDSVPAGRRLLWFGIVSVATVCSFLAAVVYQLRRRTTVLTRWPAGFVTTVGGNSADVMVKVPFVENAEPA